MRVLIVEDEALVAMFVESRAAVSVIAQALGRQPSAIRARIERLGRSAAR